MRKIGKYRVVKSIGKGGFSRVYLVMDDRIRKQWALKAVPKQPAVRKDGVFILKDLDYQDLPRIVEEMENKTCFYEVMDYFEGPTLKKYLEDKKKLELSEGLYFSLSILETMSYLHSLNPPVIFRDLKPDNLIVTRNRRLKLIDFDLAVSGERTDCEPFGTKGIAAPEQYQGICTMRSDVYNIGRTLSFIFHYVNVNKGILSAIRLRLYASCEKVIKKACSDNPQERWENAGDMLSAVKKIENRRRRIRPAVIAAAAAAAAFALAAASGLVLREAYRIYEREEILKIADTSAELIKYGTAAEPADIEKAIEILETARKKAAQLQGDKDVNDLYEKVLKQLSACCTLEGSVKGTEKKKEFYKKAVEYNTVLLGILEKSEKREDIVRMHMETASLLRCIGYTEAAEEHYRKIIALCSLRSGFAKDQKICLEAYFCLASMYLYEKQDAEEAGLLLKEAQKLPGYETDRDMQGLAPEIAEILADRESG